MRQKDLQEGPISALGNLARATQQGIAKGYTSARSGALAPDSAGKAVKKFFTPGGKAVPVDDKKTKQPKKKQAATKKSGTYVFQHKDDVYSWDSERKVWITADGKKTLKKSEGAKMWALASKRYPEGKDDKFTEDDKMKKVQEGLADLADAAEKDHEVQMARADLYKIAKYGIKLHDMLKNVSEAEGLDGWVQSKITKAADYLGSVYHHLDYDMKFNQGQMKEGKSPHKKGTKKYKKHMAAMHAESAGDSYKDSLHAKLAERTLTKDESKKKKST